MIIYCDHKVEFGGEEMEFFIAGTMFQGKREISVKQIAEKLGFEYVGSMGNQYFQFNFEGEYGIVGIWVDSTVQFDNAGAEDKVWGWHTMGGFLSEKPLTLIEALRQCKRSFFYEDN